MKTPVIYFGHIFRLQSIILGLTTTQTTVSIDMNTCHTCHKFYFTKYSLCPDEQTEILQQITKTVTE